MHLLALDQSISSTGFARWKPDFARPVTGAWPLSGGIKFRAEAFITIQQKIHAIHKEDPIDFILYEEPIRVPSDKVHKLIGLYGVAAHIESYAKRKSIGFDFVSCRDWRSTFFAKDELKGTKSDRKKRLAILRCRQFGFDPRTDDEAEATGILDHLLHTRGIQPQWRIDNPFLETLGPDS